MEEHYNNLNSLFEVDNIKTILDAGSGKSSLSYLTKKYPEAKIDAIVYPGDNRKVDSIKKNIKCNYKLIEKDISKESINEKYDLVLAHLLLGESTNFGHTFDELLDKLLNINSKYFLIYDYKEDPTINYDYFHNCIKEHDFAYVDVNTFEKKEAQEFKDFIGKNYYACFIRRLTIVDIVFRFINGYIKIGVLTDRLRNLKLCLYTEKQQDDIKKLINEIDSLTDIEKLICNESNIDNIKDVLMNNETYLEIANEMTPKDLLLMVSDYICSPRVPKIDQITFDEMVDIGIKYDAREKLWRLAFNYEHSGKNSSRIVDYFIEVKDSWYLSELVYAVGADIDKKRLVEKLLKEENVDFVKNFINSNKNSGELDEEDIKLLEEKSIL